MIIDCGLIAGFDFMTDFNGIKRHYPKAFYPAGIYDKDKTQYKYGEASSKYPDLTLPCSLYDEFGNSLPSGFYMTVLSKDGAYLNLYQSNELKARVKTVKYTADENYQKILEEEAEIIKRLEKAKEKKKLKKQRKIEEELEAFRQTEAAKNYAYIEDTGMGYYVLKYSFQGQKAEGIIQNT